MSEHEPQPRNKWNLQWEEDDQGEYVTFRKDGRDYRMTPDDVGIFTFPEYPDADHIYFCNNDYEEVIEDYTFRAEIDSKLGEGVFDFICQEFFEHGFQWEIDAQPAELDILAYYERFNVLPNKVDPFDKIVQMAIRNFDAEWQYFEPEYRQEFGI